MMDNKILGSVVFLAIIGIAFLGNGITGMVAGDEYTRPICENTADCSVDEVCCFFNGETRGLCNVQSMCESVNKITIQQYDSLSEPKDNYTSQFIVGILILISIFFILYYSVHVEPQSSKN